VNASAMGATQVRRGCQWDQCDLSNAGYDDAYHRRSYGDDEGGFVALLVIALLVVVGFVVAKAVDSIIRTTTAVTSRLAQPRVRIGTAVGVGVIIFVVGYVVLVGELSSLTRSVPNFTSLRSHPDTSLRGTVAYNALPIAAKGKKLGCVDVLPAPGGPSRQLFCASQPKAMGAALVWLADGRLQATNRGQDHWSKIVDLRSGAVSSTRWVEPPAVTSKLATGPAGQILNLSTSHGTLRLTLRSGSTSRVLLSIAVPPTYSFGQLSWSPDGQWFVVEDSGGRLLTITTGPNPETRLLLDGGTEPAVTNATP
jgi:hypothetical protein